MMSRRVVVRLQGGSRRDRLVPVAAWRRRDQRAPVAHMAPEPGHAQAVSASSEVIHAI